MGFVERSNRFTPKDLLELPRPGAARANPAGDLALISISQHSFESNETSKKTLVVGLTEADVSNQYPAIDGSTTFWLDSRTVCHVVTAEGSDEQELFAISIAVVAGSSATLGEPTSIGKLPAAADAANFKFDGNYLLFSSNVYDDEDLSTIKDQDESWNKRTTTAMTFDSLYVRHWDKYAGPKHSSLFSVRLAKTEGTWVLGNDYVALLKGSGHSVPVEPFGGEEDFEFHGNSLVYTAKDPSPKVNEATHTRQNIYLRSLLNPSEVKQLTSGTQGATKNPVFSPDGSKVAWLELAEDGYESDAAKVVLYDLVADVRYALEFAGTNLTRNGTGFWDRSPDSLAFTPGGKSLIFTAGDRARVKVFTSRVPSTPPTPPRGTSATVIAPEPIALTHDFAASAAQPLPDGRILFTQNSFNGPNNAFVLNPKTEEGDKITRITNFGSEVLDKRELAGYEDFYFTGAGGVKIQGWAVKPYGWREGQKAQWPALLLIHGGPQGAWENQWSTRWNPQVFAQHGYFVIAINPTGSTTFGQDLTDAIKGEWGGKPMVDLQKGFEYALQKYPEIDKSRTAAAGASYGGYAVNWIAGNQEKYGFNFKALVTHDGLFDTRAGGYSTEELFFWAHEFGGLPYEEDAIKTAEKWNPSLHVSKWKTPQLVIHGSKDYRLTETDGLSVFTALQIRNVPSRLVIFPDENHWVLKPANSLKWHEEVFGWIDKYIG